ncbi:MAG: hypothetical protein CMO74_06030 [Verrucomicrobiales bacterium]|nr:hypothetical protein [Verrucomicrobiales bacterium]|tara:strand:- start:3252 stop:4241 length:990 start_codon:yes stop_codon:yes gene_type:complete
MDAKVIVLLLAGAVVGGAATAVVSSSNNDEAEKDADSKAQAEARKNQQKREDRISKLASENERLMKAIEDERRKTSAMKDQRDAALAKATIQQVKVVNSPDAIIGELGNMYASNNELNQRRRIYLTESLVDAGVPALDAIEEFFRSNKDAEPDIAADRRRDMLDRYGITDDQYVSIEENIASLLQQMEPELAADRARRDAERQERRQQDEKRRADFRKRMEEFRATLTGLEESEVREKMGGFFRQSREEYEQRRREERERAQPEDQPKVETASDRLRSAVEGNVQTLLGTQQFESMKGNRSLDRMLAEIGGDSYRRAVGSDWGRGRGGR